MALLVETKLRPPKPRAGTLRRARLLRALDAAGAAPLTLVAAPAGYGKTMLLHSWCAEQGTPVIWNTLDPDDRDPVRLWTHLAAASSRAVRGLGSSALARLATPGAPFESAADSLLAEIARSETSVVIVLDDLDRLGNDESLRSVRRAMNRLPKNARLIMAARSDPAIGVATLRAKHRLSEIRARQLAFTQVEARELIVASEGIALSDASVRTLVERTEGWPVALYLAALWLRDRADPDEAAHRFGTTTRQIADYLTEEILASVDPDTKQFLGSTAVLGRFTPDLCDAALERDDSRAMLARLEHSNLLLVPLDGDGDWYRYHNLFQELLRVGLASGPAEALLRRAASWSRDRGLAEEAIAYAAGAGDFDLVADILAETAPTLGRQGRTAFIRSWLERLPPETLHERPMLTGGGAVIVALEGRPHVEVERLLFAAEESRRQHVAAWTPLCDVYASIARSVSVDNDDVGASLTHALHALGVARTSVESEIVPTLAVVARALFFTGDLRAAKKLAREAVTRPDVAGRPFGYLSALGLLAMVEAEEAHPQHASVWGKSAIELAVTHGFSDSWITSFAHVGLAGALVQLGKLGEAEREARRAEKLRRGTEGSVSHAYSLLRLAEVRIARGRLRQAEDALAAAKREIAECRDPGRLTTLALEVENSLRAPPAADSEPVEAPSPGELAVLRYLPSDLSQREIAAQLYISLNTLRTHIRSLYRKFRVHTREAAVARADALGLLEEP